MNLPVPLTDPTWEHLLNLDGATVTVTTVNGERVHGPMSFNADRPGVLTISPDGHVWTDVALKHIVTVRWRDE